ncbi:MAG: amino acid-binding protein [Chloroflexota bacterium]|nr:ACT domain-containing protein [Chloroflexota bacterium]NOG64270.1 ACT domain-containing protein [Chloroflexota bacterium]GIK65889.1 MAG: amino acid-binding protein [Chloroflexota bacterium]
MNHSAKEVLSQTPLYTDEVIYTLIKLPASAIWAGAGVLADLGEAFSVLIADKDEVTLVMALEAWQEEYFKRLPGAEQHGEFRLITFDMVLEFSLTGFMALVATILAEAGVSMIPLGAFSRDHVLVPADSFEKAWTALQASK